METRIKSRFDRIIQTSLIAIFLGLISLPFFGMAFRLNTPDLDEKRNLTPPPPISLVLHSATRFVEQLRSYLSDNFGFRTTLVKWNARVNARTLSVSPSPKVVLGKNGWLYYAEEHILEDYRCLKPFTEAELQQWASMLERRNNWLQQRGIRYLFFVAPNEHTIYPEYLPSYISRVRETSRLDQLMAYLRTHTTVSMIDIRPALIAAKAKERVYHKTDTHWNERGAFAAYQEILRPVGDWFPSIHPIPRNRFEDRSITTPGGDLASMMGLRDAYHEENLYLQPLEPRKARMITWPVERLGEFQYRPVAVMESEIPNSKLPRLVFLHDSFGQYLRPFLAEHSSRAVFISNYMGFEAPFLERESPNLVIQEMTERCLWSNYAKAFENQP